MVELTIQNVPILLCEMSNNTIIVRQYLISTIEKLQILKMTKIIYRKFRCRKLTFGQKATEPLRGHCDNIFLRVVASNLFSWPQIKKSGPRIYFRGHELKIIFVASNLPRNKFEATNFEI